MTYGIIPVDALPRNPVGLMRLRLNLAGMIWWVYRNALNSSREGPRQKREFGDKHLDGGTSKIERYEVLDSLMFRFAVYS